MIKNHDKVDKQANDHLSIISLRLCDFAVKFKAYELSSQ
jgi:hypothetical protein